MEGVHLSVDELIRTYGISRRLAVRIGALMGKGLTVTPTILEIAGAGSLAEKLLLHPQVLAEADGLTTETARQCAKEVGADEEGAFVVAGREEARVLALEEELLAEEGWQERPGAEQTALAKSKTALPAAQFLHRAESEQLFTPEEIARLKLEALAGRDAKSRISALRKLLYAPLSSREKGAIYLRVLVDPAGPVRSEAVKALESLGFNRDTADALQMVFEGDAGLRKQAIRRIGDLLTKLQPAEREIVLVVLVELFRESTPSGADDPLLQVLNEAVPLLSGNADLAKEMTRVCVQHQVVDPSQARMALDDLLLKLAGAAPGPVLEKLWEEVFTIRAPAARAQLVQLLVELEKDDTQWARLCEVVLREILEEEHDELTRQKLGYSMVALGPIAAKVMLKHYQAASNAERTRLVPFMDNLCVDESLPEEARTPLARELVNSLKMADHGLRMAVLRTRLFNQEGLSPSLKASLADELLALLSPDEPAEVAERAALMLEVLGETAVKGLLDIMRSRPASHEADMAARSLGRIFARLDSSSSAAGFFKPVLDFVLKRIAQPRNRVGGYAYALGQMAAAGIIGERAAQKAFDLLAGNLERVRYQADAVDALGRLGACDLVTAQQRVRAVHLLGGLVERPEDEEEAVLREIQTDKGRIYEITGRVEFDSLTLPAAVAGLERIALSKAATESLRARIVQMLLRVWSGVAAWNVIWGPRSSERLARSLGRIGADPGCEDALRLKILEALAPAIERLSVIKALEALFDARSNVAELNQCIVETAERILAQWMEPEIVPEELRAVLCAVANAAARPEISSRTKRARKLRRRAADLLFDALRNGHDWSRGPLEKIRDCKATPKALQKEIADRLEKAFSLIRP